MKGVLEACHCDCQLDCSTCRLLRPLLWEVLGQLESSGVLGESRLYYRIAISSIEAAPLVSRHSVGRGGVLEQDAEVANYIYTRAEDDED
ncbi:hypothetical protein E2C01_014540 [Portunus trituberculatus]|uniref:Uncharacterized protein n=1 Tax=Portunus trituberculatus TaxID=210409 RepID=A0A5B7DJ39_PORTR|nr:hypothetical protein [Portunus trituberculatus]